MKRIFLLWIGLSFLARFAFSQESLPGYVVTLESDTLKGLLFDQTDKELGTSVLFKAHAQEKEFTALTTADIVAFGFDYGRQFTRFPVNEGSGMEGDTTKVFAKKTLNGKITVYTWTRTDKNEPDIFLINNLTSDTVHLSQPAKVLVEDQGTRKYYRENNRHQGFLYLIMNDTLSDYKFPSHVKYSEIQINEEVLVYNRKYKPEYPVSVHQPRKVFSYEFTAGYPFLKPDDAADVYFRITFNRHTYIPEKSRSWSLFRGVAYRYLQGISKTKPIYKTGDSKYTQQIISLLPIGFRYQTDARILIPYFYVGAVLACEINTRRPVDETSSADTSTSFNAFPMVNPGAGVMLKVGSQYLKAEITPTLTGGTYLNLGLAFR